ncbi:hypothetical protein [Methylobacter sp.]|uniref:hypothetical protein n=1 Tax=Methylobacter sp. TaxID=2051955 RepID=UPI00248731E5|nr:hypothetical protein [Methylobacter sp.]MDI1276145.1 hypothetical protein [Methylobacter sp.]MDI1356966.1 hypothetical protein [Methylobacter sp.]
MTKFEINSQSILALYKLLGEIITSPSNFIGSSELKESLKSQGALANFEDIDRGITSSSLNTQKNVANNTLDDGYKSLDLRRNNALKALENILDLQKSKKPTIFTLKQRIHDLNHDKELLEIQNIMLIKLITNLICEVEHSCTSTPEQLQSRLKLARSEILAKVGFINETSLIKM